MPPPLLVPGASLLEVTPVAGGLRVRCPGCCTEYLVPPGSEMPTFVHADNGCPVLRTIADALARFEHTTECVG